MPPPLKPLAKPTGKRTAKPPGPFHLGSLQRRLLLAALVLVTAALVVAGIAIGLILHRFARAQLDGRLDAQIAAVASGLEQGPDGVLRLTRNLDAPPFDHPGSGWYWQVERADQVLRSGSLDGARLDIPDLPRRPKPQDTDRPRP
ncbi:sensor histidine kinase, partial [Methylobacterium trifolii]